MSPTARTVFASACCRLHRSSNRIGVRLYCSAQVVGPAASFPERKPSIASKIYVRSGGKALAFFKRVLEPSQTVGCCAANIRFAGHDRSTIALDVVRGNG